MSVFYVPGLAFKKGAVANTRIANIVKSSGAKVSSLNPIPLKELYNEESFDKRADILTQKATKKDTIIAYSAGARVVKKAIEKGAQFNKIILLGPAIESDVKWPKKSANKIHIVFNPNDELLATAALLPFNQMGALGKVGYKGPKDDRIIQYDARAINAKNTSRAHMDYADKNNAFGWREMFSGLIQDEE